MATLAIAGGVLATRDVSPPRETAVTAGPVPAAAAPSAREAALGERRRRPAPRLVVVKESAGGHAGEIAAGQILVTARDEASVEQLTRDLERAVGASLVERIGRDPALRVALPPGLDPDIAAARASRLPGAAEASSDAISRGASAGSIPGSVRWGLSAVHPESADLDAPVTIAILDSGLAYRAHVDEIGVARTPAPWLTGATVVPGLDFVHGDGSPDDANNHGTHIASLLVGPWGLARGATLMPVQVLDDALVGTESALVAGIDYAVDQGASVVNLSLAFDARYYPSRLLDRAVARALASGVVLVAAAGNGGSDKVRFPAAFPGVIAVGAGTTDGGGPRSIVPTAYTDHGPELDVLAPGGDLALDENDDGVPDGVLGSTFDPADPTNFEPWLFAGTSQAAAIVTAAAARLVAEGVGTEEVAARLRRTARDDHEGFSFAAGAGLLDIKRALSNDRPLAPMLDVALAASVVVVDGSPAMRAKALVLDGASQPVKGVVVHGRFRGAAIGAASCTTGASGSCQVTSAGVASGPVVVTFEVIALIDRKGRAVRPREVFHRASDIDPALASLADAGESVIVWQAAGPSGPVFLLRSLATDTAVAPTIAVLDAAAFGSLTGGTGFGSSSLGFFVFSYSSAWMSNGSGFGSSSYGGLFVRSGFASSSYLTLGAAYGSLASAAFVPGAVLGSQSFAQAASTASTHGAGSGMPLP